MSKRVVIRGGVGRDLKPIKDLTAVAQMEMLVQKNWDKFFSKYFEYLEAATSDIEQEAIQLVPKDTGKLMDSISVRVSKSRRYQGIICSASAMHKGYDYAIIQEENTDYIHNEGESAFYLAGPFYRALDDLYYKITKKDISVHLSDKVVEAGEYEG